MDLILAILIQMYIFPLFDPYPSIFDSIITAYLMMTRSIIMTDRPLELEENYIFVAPLKTLILLTFYTKK